MSLDLIKGIQPTMLQEFWISELLKGQSAACTQACLCRLKNVCTASSACISGPAPYWFVHGGLNILQPVKLIAEKYFGL